MRDWRDEDQRLVVGVLSEKSDSVYFVILVIIPHLATHDVTTQASVAVCQFDILRRNFPASIWRVLDDLPESLDKTYEQTLLGVDKEKRKYAQRLFQCLSVRSVTACLALKSSRRFLQSTLTRQRLPRLTKICGH